jgi:hypothetical protein
VRILVCGSRDWTNADIIWTTLDGFYEKSQRLSKPLTLIHGACNTKLDTRANKTLGIGADAIAEKWALMMGDKNVFCNPYPAPWGTFGRKAGFIRNRQMLTEGKPDIVLGFMNQESPGTKMMLNFAKNAGVKTYRIQEW